MKQFLNLNLSPNDSTWVGAWWLGFVILAGLLFVTSFPYFFFPNEMKKKRKTVELNIDNNENMVENFGNIKS